MQFASKIHLHKHFSPNFSKVFDVVVLVVVVVVALAVVVEGTDPSSSAVALLGFHLGATRETQRRAPSSHNPVDSCQLRLKARVM